MKLSIITVCFNSAGTIGDTIDSVLGQTHPEVEYVIIDGGSRDDTLSIVRSYGKRVDVVISEPDKGIYDAMNKGLAAATGEVVGFINADDFYASADVLAEVAGVFSDPDVDVCYGDLCYVRQDDTRRVVRYWRSSHFRPGLLSRGWVPPHPTFFARRRVYERYGGFDLRYRIAADFELMARFLEVHRLRSRYIPCVLVKMRMGGTTNRSIANVFLQNREIWRALHQHALRPSFGRFAGGKLLARGRQLLSRPAK